MQPNQNINYQAFDQLLKIVEYYKPENKFWSVEVFYKKFETCKIDFKDEVFRNIVSLQHPNLIAYFKQLNYRISTLFSKIEVNQDEIESYLEKYRIQIDEIYSTPDIKHNNLLANALHDRSFIPEYYGDEQRLYNEELRIIRDAFIKYFYSEAVKEMQSIVESMYNEFVLDEPSYKSNNYKIKTTLSVAELGYFFKKLTEEGIITIETGKAESFYRTIAETFESSEKGEFQNTTFKNKFTAKEPEQKTIGKIQEHFTHLMQRTKKE